MLMKSSTTHTLRNTAETNRRETGRKEGLMASTHTLTTAAFEASQKGALAGHECRCSCGFVARTSLSEREALTQGIAHVEWARKAGK